MENQDDEFDFEKSVRTLKEFYGEDEMYAEDVSGIEEDHERIEYLQNAQRVLKDPYIQSVVQECRQELLEARRLLATDASLYEDNLKAKEKIRSLWFKVATRSWILEKLSADFSEEIKLIEAQLKNLLEKIQ